MKTNYSFALFLAGCLLTGSCKNNAKTQSDNDPAKKTSCFERYSTNYEKLLTRADISKVYPVDFSKAEKEYDTANTSPKYEELLYTWPSDRKRTYEVLGNEVTIPVDNKIGMGSIRFYPKEEKFPKKLFRNMYEIIEAEKKKYKEAIKNQLEKNEKIDAGQKENAAAMADGLMSSNKYSFVEGVGDAAVWDYMESSLIVLSGRARFTVFVNVGTDHKKEVELAKKLAKQILAKCE